MSLSYGNFRLDEVRDVVNGLGRTFHAIDVWEHETVRAMHRPATRREIYTYRQMVGKYLMDHRRELGLTDTHRETAGRGRLWERRRA